MLLRTIQTSKLQLPIPYYNPLAAAIHILPVLEDNELNVLSGKELTFQGTT